MQGFRNNKSHGFNQVLIYVSIGKPMTQASCHQSDKWQGVIGSHLGSSECTIRKVSLQKRQNIDNVEAGWQVNI